MCSECDIPQKSVLLTTLSNLNDLKNHQIYEIRLTPAPYQVSPVNQSHHLYQKHGRYV